MLTHKRSLISTMKMSYDLMKELSEGYHAGIAEIERKHDGAEMGEQLSQMVQALYGIPWEALRKSIDQSQLEELFGVLAEAPQTVDQIQDMIWSVCVASLDLLCLLLLQLLLLKSKMQ